MIELDLDPKNMEDSSREGSKIIAFRIEFKTFEKFVYGDIETIYQISYSPKYDRFKVKYRKIDPRHFSNLAEDEVYYDFDDAPSLNEVLELCKHKLKYYYQINNQNKTIKNDY